MIPVVHHKHKDIEFWDIELSRVQMQQISTGKVETLVTRKLTRHTFTCTGRAFLELRTMEHEIEVLRLDKKSHEISFIFWKPADEKQKTQCLFKGAMADWKFVLKSLECRDLQTGKVNFSLAPAPASELSFHDPEYGKMKVNARTMDRTSPE